MGNEQVGDKMDNSETNNELVGIIKRVVGDWDSRKIFGPREGDLRNTVNAYIHSWDKTEEDLTEEPNIARIHVWPRKPEFNLKSLNDMLNRLDVPKSLADELNFGLRTASNFFEGELVWSGCLKHFTWLGCIRYDCSGRGVMSIQLYPCQELSEATAEVESKDGERVEFIFDDTWKLLADLNRGKENDNPRYRLN